MFSGCATEGQDVGAEALSWFNRIERIRITGKLKDEEVLFLVGEYLVKKAETWYNVVGSKAANWDQFSTLFKKQYLVDEEDKWWSMLQNMKQGKNDSIDDIALKMEELFDLLGNTKESYRVRTFLNAIDKKIAYEIEKEGTPSTFKVAKLKAKQIEKSQRKYQVIADPEMSNYFHERSFNGGTDYYQDNRSEISSLAAKLEQLTINLVKLSDNVNNGRHYSGNSPVVKSEGQNYPKRKFTCFHCNQEGHKKWECPDLMNNRRQGLGTGSNAIPIGAAKSSNESSGKANEHQ